MRLIDADALAKKWQDVLDYKADEKGTAAYTTFELFIERLADEPTIEAEPVRHGRWEYRAIDTPNLGRKYEMYCTACGKTPDPKKDFDWCPMCGAKMDKENDNG